MLRRLVFVVSVVVLWCPVVGRSQQPSQRQAPASLGLSSVGAVSIHVGGAALQRSIRGAEVGTTIDLGHFASRRVRLLADASYLRSFPFSERVESEGKSYRDVFYDLSGHVAVAVRGTSVTARLSPYVAGGVGIHVLSSTFGSLAIDTRYNTNNFGLMGLAGMHVRVGSGLRRSMLVEVRRVHSKNVRRLSVHLGLSALFNDLARR